MNSKSFSLNFADVLPLIKNAALVSAAAGLSYVMENVSSLNLGTAGVLLVPIVSIVLDSIIKWAKDNTKK